jgi:hypothetical protein
MTRILHRWTPPQRPSAILSIRSCTRCGLVMHSRHEVDEGNQHRVDHWKEYYTIDAPDIRLTKMPECVREKETI